MLRFGLAICSLLALINPGLGAPIAQQAYLKAANTGAGDRFGRSVAVAGDTMVVGADWEASAATGVNGNQGNNGALYAGAAYVFVRDGTNWSQQAYLKASNTGRDDNFGVSVAISGDTIVVGAWGEDSNATEVDGDQSDNNAAGSGAAYVFARNGTTWSEHAYLKASNTGTGDGFATQLAVSGDTVVVGALWEASNATGINGNQSNNGAAAAGAAYVFTKSTAVPQLASVRTETDILLSWPVEATGYALETATSLPALSWDPVTIIPAVSVTEHSVQLPITGPAKFLRLRKP